jgi:hypothetical protein
MNNVVLKQDAVRLAGGPDNHSFIMHGKSLILLIFICFFIWFISVYFLKFQKFVGNNLYYQHNYIALLLFRQEIILN